MHERKVVRADSPACAELKAQGWFVIARSWGAGLIVDDQQRDRLRLLVDRAQPLVRIREIEATDVDAAIALDRATIDDYPGDIATAHEALTTASAKPAAAHRGWGAFIAESELVAMTFANIGPDVTETDFTVVRRDRRGQGLGTAVKAACLLALADEGHVAFRTGGSMDNPASIAANRAVGYELDEEWLTLALGE